MKRKLIPISLQCYYVMNIKNRTSLLLAFIFLVSANKAFSAECDESPIITKQANCMIFSQKVTFEGGKKCSDTFARISSNHSSTSNVSYNGKNQFLFHAGETPITLNINDTDGAKSSYFLGGFEKPVDTVCEIVK